jgi:hypothetical protein
LIGDAHNDAGERQRKNIVSASNSKKRRCAGRGSAALGDWATLPKRSRDPNQLEDGGLNFKWTLSCGFVSQQSQVR